MCKYLLMITILQILFFILLPFKDKSYRNESTVVQKLNNKNHKKPSSMQIISKQNNTATENHVKETNTKSLKEKLQQSDDDLYTKKRCGEDDKSKIWQDHLMVFDPNKKHQLWRYFSYVLVHSKYCVLK